MIQVSCDRGFRTLTRRCTRFFELSPVTNGTSHPHLKRFMFLWIVWDFVFTSEWTGLSGWGEELFLCLFSPIYLFPDWQRKVFMGGRVQVQASINSQFYRQQHSLRVCQSLRVRWPFKAGVFKGGIYIKQAEVSVFSRFTVFHKLIGEMSCNQDYIYVCCCFGLLYLKYSKTTQKRLCVYYISLKV